MKDWERKREQAEADALRIDALEREAEGAFDRVVASAALQAQPERVRQTQEFKAWIAARHDSDAAWGRWFEVMGEAPSGH